MQVQVWARVGEWTQKRKDHPPTRSTPTVLCLPMLYVALDLGLGDQPLFRGLFPVLVVSAFQNDFVIIGIVVLVEESFLVINRAGGDFHFQGVLFRILLHFLQVLIVAVLGQPVDHISVRPVDLERVCMLIIYVVLSIAISIMKKVFVSYLRTSMGI